MTKPYMGDRAMELGTGSYVDACVAAIQNTAERLGLDPVAFAEACQDGEKLASAIGVMAMHNAEWQGWLTAIKAKGGTS